MRTLAIMVLAACGGGGDGVDAAPPANGGLIWIESTDAASAVDASFWTGDKNCTSLGTAGPCKAEQCPGTTTPFHNAGTITVTGGALPVTLMPDIMNGYSGFGADQMLFSGGETLTVAAIGAEVPAFTASITAPAKATITSPLEPSSTSSVPITRSAGFPISWTGGSGQILVSLFGGPSNTTSVTCTFDASARTGMVPADALMALPYGAGYLWMATIADTSVTAGDWGVKVEGYHESVWPDGSVVEQPTDVE